jgi:hypothetical protein
LDSVVEQFPRVSIAKPESQAKITMMQDFYISLPSNSVFTGNANTTSEFRVRLPGEIDLGSELWEVALVEFQYPYTWNNLESGDNVINVISKHNDVVRLAMHPGQYETIHSLLSVMKKSFECVEVPSASLNPKMCRSFVFVMDFINHHVILKCTQPPLLQSIHISKHLQYMLGFDTNVFDTGIKVVRAKYPPDMRGGIDSLFVYCDLIVPQIVGNTKQQLLRIVPVSGTYGEVVDKVFVAPHYVRLLKKKFSTIEMSINTDQNKPIMFQSGKTVIKLHFRRYRSLRI